MRSFDMVTSFALEVSRASSSAKPKLFLSHDRIFACRLDVATSSARPANFVSLSPSAKSIESRDPVATGLSGLAALAVLAFAAAVYFVLTM